MKRYSFLKQALRESYRIPLFELGRRSGSFLPIIPIHPVSATILVTHNCNSRCIMCNMWRKKSGNELTSVEVCNILVQLKELGIYKVGFSGGEALLRKDLPIFIRKARDLRFERVTVLTNGLLLKERARELLSSGLNEISLSLDGPKRIHDACRGVDGAYERCIEGLKAIAGLQDAHYGYLDKTVSMTLMHPTINSIPHLIDVCKEYGASLFINLFDNRQLFFKNIEWSHFNIKDRRKLNAAIDKLHKAKEERPSLVVPTHSALEFAKNYFGNPRTKEIPCVSGYLCIYIDAYANVYPGCWVLPPIGNLREKKLRDIIFSMEYKERLKEMFVKKCPGCDCGFLANLWFHLPSLIQEFSWYIKSTYMHAENTR